jgi:hypothetical protein
MVLFHGHPLFPVLHFSSGTERTVGLNLGTAKSGNHALFLMNVIMFIIRVLKLLSMKRKFWVIALIVFLLGAAPVAGSTGKIAAGAPVYIGESNLDISKALNGCHTIAWWHNATNSSAPPEKTIILYEINTVSDKIYHYNISPETFARYTGTWYCVDKKPQKAVFEVLEPQLDIKVWDLDHNQDVSGKSVPVSTNITYRVDTNLYPALKPLIRPDVNPSDSFYTVSLIDSYGQSISNIFTGSAGNPTTQILPFDKQPFITESPFYWKNGKDWNRSARNANGEPLYSAGTYTFTISQNLNHMLETYRSSGITDFDGKITKTTTITFIEETPPLTIPVTTQPPLLTTIPVTATISSTTASTTTVPTSSPIAKKTTYTPLPVWITLIGIIVAGLFILPRNR